MFRAVLACDGGVRVDCGMGRLRGRSGSRLKRHGCRGVKRVHGPEGHAPLATPGDASACHRREGRCLRRPRGSLLLRREALQTVLLRTAHHGLASAALPHGDFLSSGRGCHWLRHLALEAVHTLPKIHFSARTSPVVRILPWQLRTRHAERQRRRWRVTLGALPTAAIVDLAARTRPVSHLRLSYPPAAPAATATASTASVKHGGGRERPDGARRNDLCGRDRRRGDWQRTLMGVRCAPPPTAVPSAASDGPAARPAPPCQPTEKRQHRLEREGDRCERESNGTVAGKNTRKTSLSVAVTSPASESRSARRRRAAALATNWWVEMLRCTRG